MPVVTFTPIECDAWVGGDQGRCKSGAVWIVWATDGETELGRYCDDHRQEAIENITKQDQEGLRYWNELSSQRRGDKPSLTSVGQVSYTSVHLAAGGPATMTADLRVKSKFPVWFDEGATWPGDFSRPEYKGMLPLQILEASNLDRLTQPCEYGVVIPAYGEPGDEFYTPPEVLNSGDKLALVWGKDHNDPQSKRHVVGHVGPGYRVFQHHEFAQALEPIAEKFPVVMFGGLGKYQEKLYFGLDAGEYTPKKGGKPLDSETTRDYIYVANSNDGGTGITGFNSTIRCSCLNMAHFAMEHAAISFEIRHSAAAVEYMTDWIRYIDDIKRIVGNNHEEITRMLSTGVTPVEAKAVMEAAYIAQMPKLVTQYGVENRDGLPAQVTAAQERYAEDLGRMQRYQIEGLQEYEKVCDENPLIAGTQWAVMNAVTARESWRDGRGAQESLLYGSRADIVRRAHGQLLELAR